MAGWLGGEHKARANIVMQPAATRQQMVGAMQPAPHPTAVSWQDLQMRLLLPWLLRLAVETGRRRVWRRRPLRHRACVPPRLCLRGI